MLALIELAGCEVSSGPAVAPSSTSDSQPAGKDNSIERQFAYSNQSTEDSLRETVPISTPTADQHVVLAAALFPSRARPGGTVTLAVRIRVAAGWHIYAVGKDLTGPSLATILTLRLPNGLMPEGDWLLPEPETYSDRLGTHLVYRGDIALRRKLKIVPDKPPGKLELSCTVSYQACDAKICVRPEPVDLRTIVELEDR